MSQPTTLTISYSGGSGSPQTIPIPVPTAGSVGGVAQTSVPMDYTAFVKSIFAAGGFWFLNAGVETFVQWGEITSITAQ
jgi:hypothetical protein